MQRVESLIMDNNENPSSSRSKKIRNHVASVLVSVGFIGIMLGLYTVVYAIDGILPKPLYLADEKGHPDAFITERARQDLKLLTDIGPRVARSNESEILAVELLKRKVDLIMQSAHKNQKLELDIQSTNTTDFYMLFPFSNVIVKLYGENNVSQTVLVNAHFDSAETSPGGSDDGINCAVMLEILRKLSSQPRKPLNNVIFLFNGAEETGLQAAQGFITEHKWAKDCKVVLNLEATGAGGKIILFQTGPDAPWLMKYYHKVPHPYAQVAGEEMFQRRLIPTATDYRIFRDYGGLVGLDMAFFKNGWRYHTKYDGFNNIPLGSFQHVGDNALSLVKDLANAPEVSNPKKRPGQMVYFDFLGLFVVSYSTTVALVLNYIVVLLSFGIFIYSVLAFQLGSKLKTLSYLALTFGAIIGGWIAAAVFVAATAFILHETGYSLGWYMRPWLILGLYSIPTVACSGLFLPFVNNEDTISRSINSQIQIHIVRIIWTVILFAGTILNIRSMYILLIPVLFNTMAFTMIYFFKWLCRNKCTEIKSQKIYKSLFILWKWEVLYVITLVIPTMFMMYGSLLFLSIFIPYSARFGPGVNPDLIVGMLTFLWTLLATSSFMPLTVIVKNFKYFTILLGVLFIASFIIIFTPLGVPSSEQEL